MHLFKTSKVAILVDENREVVDRLATIGFDFSRPAKVEFAIDCPTPEAMDSAEYLAKKDSRFLIIDPYFDEGEEVEPLVDDDDDGGFGPSWTLYLTIEMRIDAEAITSLEKEFSELFGRFGCKPDGWQVQV